MRKLESASKAAGLVRTESCNHEEGTIFYAIEILSYQLTGRDAAPEIHPAQARRLVKKAASIYGQ